MFTEPHLITTPRGSALYLRAMRPLFLASLLAIVVLLLGWGRVEPVASQGEGWFAASRRTEGQADLWVLPANGGAWQRLTATPDDERWPAWHPAGHTLAYAARRERNWDLYTFDLRTGEERRWTTNAHFEGWPAWSPDGTRLAFASGREGELDVFVLDLATGAETNVTPTSSAHDFEPRWEDDDHLLFVCTESGSHDVHRLDLRTGEAALLLDSATRGERQPMPLPNGADDEMLVVAKEGRASNVVPLEGGDGAALSWSGAVTSAALSPGGDSVAWLERRVAGDLLYTHALDGGATRLLNGPTTRVEDLAWGAPSVALLRRHVQPPEADVPPPASTFEGWVRLDDLDAEIPRFGASVVDSFQTLRGRVAGEVGFDFLGTMSEATRPIDFYSAESDYLSWHKSGRALDTLFDLGWRGNFQRLETVREDWHGEVYWGMWLRCPVQDGTCGEPLVDRPWDHSYYARWERTQGQGGYAKLFQPGYYVNFTRIAEDEGWTRISSYETPAFDWRQNSVALEYWHYQRSDERLWYDAMLDVYSQDEMNEFFGWTDLMETDLPRWQLQTKGVPLPPDVRAAPAELVVP